MDKPEDKTRTDLLRALTSNRVKKFRKILKRKGWPKDSSWSDYEFLVKALREGRKKFVHVILDNDARVSKNIQYVSPLHIAAGKATRRWTKVIARLLSHGARVADKTSQGETAVHVAFDSCAPVEAIDLMLQAHLLRGKSVDVANKNGLSFLHIACAKSNLTADKVVRFVGEDNVNSQVSITSGKNYAGYTALHFAVENSRHDVAELLIKKGARIDKGDCNGTTPVHLALRLRDVRMIDLLLACDKEKKHIVDKFGLSHFMAACAGSEKNVVEAYLTVAQSQVPLYDMITAQTGQIENSNIDTGYTPLHFAVDLGQIETVEFLLAEGVDCCVMTSNGFTSHMIAEKRGHEQIQNMLQEHCQIANTCMLMRSQEYDFGKWGEEYERCNLIERVKEIRRLRKTLDEFKSMSETFKPSVKTVNID